MHITVVSGSLDPWTTPDRPDWSGRARHLSEVVDTLAAGGHHVDAVAPGDPSIDPPGGGPVVHRVAGMAGAPPDRVVEALTAALRRLWRGGRPDVVHAYHWTAVLAARSAAPGVPVAQLVHGAAMEAGGGRGAVERAVLRDVDRVLVTSVEDRRRLFAAGVEPDRLQIVPGRCRRLPGAVLDDRVRRSGGDGLWMRGGERAGECAHRSRRGPGVRARRRPAARGRTGPWVADGAQGAFPLPGARSGRSQPRRGAYRRAHGVEAMDQALDRARARSAVAG